MQKKPKIEDEFWRALVDTQPYGLELTIDQAKSWFDTVWPKYASHNYKNHKRAISSWWSRVWERDLIDAMMRLDRIEERKAVVRMEARLPSFGEIHDIPDFFEEVDRT